MFTVRPTVAKENRTRASVGVPVAGARRAARPRPAALLTWAVVFGAAFTDGPVLDGVLIFVVIVAASRLVVAFVTAGLSARVRQRDNGGHDYHER